MKLYGGSRDPLFVIVCNRQGIVSDAEMHKWCCNGSEIVNPCGVDILVMMQKFKMTCCYVFICNICVVF